MLQSARKTGRVIIAHEAPMTNGFGAEIAATVQVMQVLLWAKFLFNRKDTADAEKRNAQ